MEKQRASKNNDTEKSYQDAYKNYVKKSKYKGQDFDVCIVGSGASGMVAAKELSLKGFKVALLEKGDWIDKKIERWGGNGLCDWGGAEDELLNKSWKIYSDTVEDDPTYFSETKDEKKTQTNIGYSHNLIGGGTRLYAGASWRFREQDFRKHSLYGDIPGATNTDWPIHYSEMEPFYTKAEIELGISGDTCNDPTEPFRSNANSLQKPIEHDKYSEKLIKGAESLGLKPFSMPMALATENPTDKNCKRSGWCSGFPCAFDAKSSVDLRLLPKADFNNLEIYTNHMAYRVEISSRGRCTGVLCRDLEKDRWVFISARVIVLAASGIQSTRLLLNSTSNQFDEGLANINGLLGKNLMFHIYSKQLGVFKQDFEFTLNKLIGINDFYFPSKDRQNFPNHCSIASGSKWMPIKYARKARHPSWGSEFIQRMVNEWAKTQILQAAVEDLPQESNCITLHPTETDVYGMPCPVVTHKYHELDRAALQYTLGKCAAILDASGAEIREYSSAHNNISDNYTYHLMGSCRMGFDESDSILNKYCQSHAVPNLFVIDGSVFPTSAAVNPTLTIQANAYRVAECIDQLAKNYKFSS